MDSTVLVTLYSVDRGGLKDTYMYNYACQACPRALHFIKAYISCRILVLGHLSFTVHVKKNTDASAVHVVEVLYSQV